LAGQRSAEPHGEVVPEIPDRFAYAVALHGLPLTSEAPRPVEPESKPEPEPEAKPKRK
jgi:hypothetical protein